MKVYLVDTITHLHLLKYREHYHEVWLASAVVKDLMRVYLKDIETYLKNRNLTEVDCIAAFTFEGGGLKRFGFELIFGWIVV